MYGLHETKAYIRLVASLLPNVLEPLRGISFTGPGCSYTAQSLRESIIESALQPLTRAETRINRLGSRATR